MININDMLKMDFYYLANILSNTNDILKINIFYLVNTLTNTNKILKVASYHLASTLTNTNNKFDNFTKKKLIATNQMLISCY